MKAIKYISTGAALLFAATLQAQIDTSQLQLLPSDQVPKFGTFWLESTFAQDAFRSPPLPSFPDDWSAPVYALANGQFLIDDTDASATFGLSPMAMMSAPFSMDSGTGGPAPRNYQKFMTQVFSLVDTNIAAETDTNLYSALVSFPNDTNTGPDLQIMLHRTNVVLIRANHFDYSAETRDFALLVCDNTAAPVWKAIDLGGASDSQDGWLIQGMVFKSKVADPMYFMVSNLNPAYPEFFRAIPYGGPLVQLLGAQQYDVVSNTITLQASIQDLSGTVSSNSTVAVTVNGLSTRSVIGPGTTITLDTHYAPNGPYQDVELSYGSVVMAIDPTNPPLDQLFASRTTTSLSLDFENTAYLANPSDMCSSLMSNNVIVFGLNQPDVIDATIFDPASGRTLATNHQSVASPGTVAIPWNFTELDGLTPYTNNTYAVKFVKADPITLLITNTIDTNNVRFPSGVVITYAESGASNDPPILNTWADTWIAQTLNFLYNDIYDQLGLTQYYPWQIGSGRNNTAFAVDVYAQTTPQTAWRLWLAEKLGSPLFSDATFGPCHGSAIAFGGDGADTHLANTKSIAIWVRAAGPRWRMRKVAQWSCQSAYNGWAGAIPVTNAYYISFNDAYGVRLKPQQDTSYMMKNVGLFFAKTFDQAKNTAQAEVATDEYWVTGNQPWPGGCDPTVAIWKAVAAAGRDYPDMQESGATAVLHGYWWMDYSGMFDAQLMAGDNSNIH